MTEVTSAEDLLVYENLAFTTPNPHGDGSGNDNSESNGILPATARAPFVFRDPKATFPFGSSPVTLNVELFGDPSWSKILLFVPGVCASAETWTAQNLVRICASLQWRMAVLELEGHGLSQGSRGVIGNSWDRCVRQVVGFCRHVLKVDQAQKKDLEGCSQQQSRFVLSGGSLGGALSAYASQSILQDETNQELKSAFCGTLLLSPAVGVDPDVVPPPYIVGALTALSWVIPAVGIEGATPTEDPSSYSCPSWTDRNFKGAWPLGTSKMLLDVTSTIVPNDVANGKLNLLLHQGLENYSLKVIAGDADPVVPIQAVRAFVDGMKAKAQETKSTVEATLEFVEIPKGEHSLLSQSVDDPKNSNTQKQTTEKTIEQVTLFLKGCQ